MKQRNNKKQITATAIGILSAWIVLIAFALYKQMETKMIVLFIVMFISSGIVPVISMYKQGKKGCSSNVD